MSHCARRLGPALAGLLASVAACAAPKAARAPARELDAPRGSASKQAEGVDSAGGDDGMATAGEQPPTQETQPVEAPAAQSETTELEPADAPTMEHESSLAVHGSLSTWWRSRNTPGAHDNDLRSVLALDIGDPTKDAYSAHVLGQGTLDLDGDSDDAVAGLSDTYDSALTGRLYDAYVDLNAIDGLERVRLGRQLDYETPELAWFDGAFAASEEFSELRAQVGVYGGIPVHPYESSPAGDALLGAFASAKPWQGNRLRLDWMHFQDERGEAEYEDDLLGARAWQRFGPAFMLEAGYTRLGQDDRDLRARATWSDADDDLTLEASWYQLFEAQADLSLELDPFYATLLELFPYSQARFLASKGFGERLDLQAGVDLRHVSDEDDVGDFNRDFERYFLRADLQDTLPAELDLGAIGEMWVSDGSDVETWGLDLEREFGAELEASLGTLFALYKFDAASQEERENVRTWFLRLRWKRSKSTTFDAQYDFEDSDGTDFHTVRLGGTWRF
jgi:hypothetical protein